MSSSEITENSIALSPDKAHVNADIVFKIVGANDQVHHARSNTLSTTDLSFNTEQPLQPGMLLQMTMNATRQNSPSLQTMVEVVNIEPLDDATGFRVNSNIKDIAVGM